MSIFTGEINENALMVENLKAFLREHCHGDHFDSTFDKFDISYSGGEFDAVFFYLWSLGSMCKPYIDEWPEWVKWGRITGMFRFGMRGDQTDILPRHANSMVLDVSGDAVGNKDKPLTTETNSLTIKAMDAHELHIDLLTNLEPRISGSYMDSDRIHLDLQHANISAKDIPNIRIRQIGCPSDTFYEHSLVRINIRNTELAANLDSLLTDVAQMGQCEKLLRDFVWTYFWNSPIPKRCVVELQFKFLSDHTVIRFVREPELIAKLVAV